MISPFFFFARLLLLRGENIFSGSFLEPKNHLRIFQGSKLNFFKNHEAHFGLCNSYKKNVYDFSLNHGR